MLGFGRKSYQQRAQKIIQRGAAAPRRGIFSSVFGVGETARAYRDLSKLKRERLRSGNIEMRKERRRYERQERLQKNKKERRIEMMYNLSERQEAVRHLEGRPGEEAELAAARAKLKAAERDVKRKKDLYAWKKAKQSSKLWFARKRQQRLALKEEFSQHHEEMRLGRIKREQQEVSTSSPPPLTPLGPSSSTSTLAGRGQTGRPTFTRPTPSQRGGRIGMAA